MFFNVDSWEVNISCPKCNTSIKVSLGQVEREEAIKCPSCGVVINLRDKNRSVRDGTKKIQDALDDLDRTIRKFSR